MKCPSNAAMYCGQSKKTDIVRSGKVEGRQVKGIILDTGCSRTLMRKDLVPRQKVRYPSGVHMETS